MHCPRCQHENRPQAQFCEECGTLTGVNPSSPLAPVRLKVDVIVAGGSLTPRRQVGYDNDSHRHG